MDKSSVLGDLGGTHIERTTNAKGLVCIVYSLLRTNELFERDNRENGIYFSWCKIQAMSRRIDPFLQMLNQEKTSQLNIQRKKALNELHSKSFKMHTTISSNSVFVGETGIRGRQASKRLVILQLC